MSDASKKRARVLALIVAGVAIAVAAYFALRAREAPVTPTEAVPPTWSDARTSPMHAAHVGREKIACTECHAGGFDRKPEASICARCHEREAKKPHLADAAAPCLTCHAFGAKAKSPACVDCHVAGDDARAKKVKQHARADLACTSCHHPHGEDKGRLADCTACHTGASATHGRFAASGADADAGIDAAVLAFAGDAGDLRAASAPLGLAPDHPPPGQVCSACHQPHRAKEAAVDTCQTCHVSPPPGAPAAPRILASGPRVAGHEACIMCHEPHRARKADVRACDGCHADHRGASAVQAHAACTTCHQPHAPTLAASACASCHAGKTALAATKVSAHASCESCHDPHEPKASPALACAKCHASVAPAHPPAKTGACTGCHEPHPKKPDVVAAACSSCHTKASSDHAFHAPKATCTGCHSPHQFATATAKATGAAGAAFCARCHDAQVKAVAPRTGHADCRGCHGEPHAPTKKPACQTCHAQEAATAPKGHAQCTSCHEPHSGSLGNHASCTSCHTGKDKALHGNVSHGGAQGCASCHRPHGPKGLASPPACTTCHAAAKLPGLHAKPTHAASCTSCHSSHAPPHPDRATCTSTCHVDRKNHQPEAKLCIGCHVFRD